MGKDIDFRNHPDFSKKYYLRADNEIEVRGFSGIVLIGFWKSSLMSISSPSVVNS
jgi:hypothetical protein